jgi:predicted pyridoxine 5'-phosphate oxidase superfamily flavin-nucleotide-binding protein
LTREDAAAFAAIQAASYERAAPALLGSWPRERALGADGLAAFLDSQRFCVLATVTASGRPQARPVRFAVADCAFWIATVGGARLRNVRANPQVSLVVAVGGPGEHTAVLAEGPVEIHDRGPGALGSPEWAAAFLELRPERLFSYSEG